MTHIAFAEELTNGRRPKQGSPRASRPGHILVVEDNDSIRRLIQIVLTGAGHEVHTVNDAESAIEAARRC